MEDNPYRAPDAAIVETAAAGGTALAGRGVRLGAAIVDGLIMMALVMPILFLTGYFEKVMAGQVGIGTIVLYGLMGLALFVVVQGMPLSRYGQTWGKRLLKIRIADLQGAKPSLATLLLKRYLPVQVASSVPVIGGLLVLVDSLMIFRDDRRCAHDLIAGTQVVNAD